MQYAHKHDPNNPDDAQLLNAINLIASRLKLITQELTQMNESIGLGANSLNSIHQALLTFSRHFEAWLPKR